jgi:hypothetical protein
MTKRWVQCFAAFAFLFCCASDAWSAVERVVILKVDGLPFDTLNYYVRRKDPRTGKSILPWIDHLFYDRGTQFRNFYNRGLSLSAASWALLDSGQPPAIKGNLEFDRLTLRSYDYLNMFTHILRNSTGSPTATPAAQVMDEQGILLLSDAYDVSEKYVSLQVLSRGLMANPKSATRLFSLQSPKGWLDEWTIGLQGDELFLDTLERDLISKLKDPQVRYLDFLLPIFDHVAHVNREPEAIQRALQEVDSAVGAVWAEIEKSPLADRTVLIVVSDHGMNTDPEVYSQGYDLIDLFASAKGGGHHVVTNRPPLGEYDLKPQPPTLPQITTASPASYYLKGQSDKFPTMLLDADGNERASIYLRDSDLNTLQILWQQLARKDIKPDFRRAATDAFFAVLDRRRESWSLLHAELQQELAAMRRNLQQLESHPASTKRFAPVSPATATAMKADEAKYAAYVLSLGKLIALKPDSFDPVRTKIEEVLAAHSVGGINSVYQLQNYVAGLSNAGLVLSDDGSLDMAKSFFHIDYFNLMEQIRAKNNVQAAVSSRPVDFVAASISASAIRSALPSENLSIDDAVWLYGDGNRQALILGRRAEDGQVWLRYLPVRDLKQSRDGRIQFSPLPWQDKLPLEIWEGLQMPEEQRQAWLESWHTEHDWMNAVYLSRYSNGVISIHDEFAFASVLPDLGVNAGTDKDLLRRFYNRKRRLAQADFIVFANDHWNFNYRGLNPGGNHGSFLRQSTHSTLMFTGGQSAGIPEGLAVDHPYDSFSFLPTIFKLTGQLTEKGMSQELLDIGFKPFPGSPLPELFEPAR